MGPDNTKGKIILGLILTMLLGIFLIWGLKDEQDPFWTELDEWMVTDVQTLDKSVGKLQNLYQNLAICLSLSLGITTLLL